MYRVMCELLANVVKAAARPPQLNSEHKPYKALFLNLNVSSKVEIDRCKTSNK